MWEKIKGTTKCDKRTAICDVAPEATPSPPFPMASDSEDVDDDEGDDDDASDDNGVDANSTDEMFTWHSYPLSLVTKRGSSFGWIWE